MSTSKLWKELAANKKFREEFNALQLKRGVPFQVRALLKKKRWTQEQLAEYANLSQGVVSRVQNPNYGNLTINTIARVAAGFDVAFVGRFVPFSELVDWFEDLSEEESANIESFEKEYKKLMQGIPRSIPRHRRPGRSLRVVTYKRGSIPFIGANAGAEQLRLPLPEPEPTQPSEIVRKVLKMTLRMRGHVAIANAIQGVPGRAGHRLAGGL